MKKTLITIISALCIVATSATMAVAATTAPKSAARSTMAGACLLPRGSRRSAHLLRRWARRSG